MRASALRRLSATQMGNSQDSRPPDRPANCTSAEEQGVPAFADLR
jgi:hypothetical protein